MPERGGERGGSLRSLRHLIDHAAAAGTDAREGAPALEVAPETPVCPECAGRGWVLHRDGGAGTAVRCPCTVRDLLPRLLAEAGIPSRYQGCRLENFQLTGSRSQQLRRARETTARWIEEFLASGRP